MPLKTKLKTICPNCNSKNTIKRGKRKRKFRVTQQFQCKDCNKFFSPQSQNNKTYPLNVILKSISTYNLGFNLKQTSERISNKYKIKIPISTLSSWLNEYKPICIFHRLRSQAIKLRAPEQMLFSHKLHHNQLYKYQLHQAKLELLKSELPEQKFQLLKDYLNKIPTEKFPHHIFKPKQEELEELSRSSQMKFETLDFVKLTKQNLANKLADLGLMLAKTNKERHQAIQNFMLINDSTTIAAEVPVYLTGDDIKYFKSKGFTFNLENHRTPITGHIDIIQIRNNLIHILDYKPEANKVNAINQLTIYALALASRTKLDLKSFKCAWFDENNYFEFFPLHAVYRKKEAENECRAT